jgi:PST family polysaccharide transporter
MEEIKNKTLSGIKWTYLSSFLVRGLYPIVVIFLARLLNPVDFGLAAMAIAVTGFFACFSDIGLRHALVQRKGDDEKVASTAFWILLPLGVFWFLLIWIISPYVASYLKNQEVIPLLRFLGLMFVIQPFSDVPLAMLLTDLKFKALFYRQLIPQLFSGLTSIILAFLGYGAWALVIGNLAGFAGTAVVVWKVSNWRPRYYINKEIFKSMFQFGSFVSLQNILGWMIVRVDNLFVGRFLGATVLGIYRMGYTYGTLPSQLVGTPFHNVVFPLLCKINRNMQEVREKYLLYIKWISTASIPTGIAYIFVMPYLVPVLLGNKWLSTIPILQLIALTSMLSSIVGVNAEAYKAIGRPDVMVKFFFLRVVISLPFYFLAAQKSIIILAFTHVSLACFFVPINMYISSRILGIKYPYVLKKLITGFLLGLIFIVIGVSYHQLIRENIISNPIGNVLCLALSFLIIGGISLFVIDKKIFNSLLNFIKNTFTFQGKEVAL